VLVVQTLTKRFPGRPRPAIEDVQFEVRDGEILGLVGLNGAGKTTTIRIAAGVSLPTRGTVLVDGNDIVQEKRHASERVGWVPELFPFEPEARALPLLVYHAGFHGIPGAEARTHGRELLARVGLAEVENDRIRTFSQGMKKRFSLACAMVSDPPNLLLDEILNGLDPEGIAFVRNWTAELRRQGKAVLLSSHLLTELQALADRVAFVHHGHILRTISRAELASAGEPMFRVTIANLDPAALEYLGSVGTPRTEGSTVFVSRPKIEAASLNAELVRRGYQVTELRVETTSLESYFLGLIGSAG
jgi:ABC-2 type transport system ATP-binding protein